MTDTKRQGGKPNSKTQKENALGTQTDNTRKEREPDKGYSGSADNEGGNSLDKTGSGVDGA